MIPIKITLRNFMCYRDGEEVLDLTGVHLACLSGENGAGKSAILAALTWALWGRARDRVSDDELMSKGASEMEVDYVFMLKGERYRVIRKRLRKGNGTTLLDLQVCSDEATDSWKTLSGATVRESQAQINDLLKIDYDTFINSAYLMQGRADEFTVKSAADRKKVLADILGLEQYDRLEERAKEEARDRKSRMTDLDNAIKRIDSDLMMRPTYIKELAAVEAELMEVQKDLATLRSELTEVQSRQQTLEHSSARLAELKERIGKREAAMVSAQARILQYTAQKEEYEGLLDRRGEIEQGYTAWQEAQTEERRFNTLADKRHLLEREQSELEQQIAIERAGLSSKTREYEERIARLSRNLAGRGTVEVQLAEVLDKLQKLEQVQQQAEDTRCNIENLDVKLRTLTNERTALKAEGQQLRQKSNMITEAHAEAGHAPCPLCGTGLSAEALERVRRSFEEDINKKLDEYEEKSKLMDNLNKQIVTSQKLLEAEREQLKPLSMHRQREATLRSKIASLDTEEQELTEYEGLLVQARTTLGEDNYAHEARKRLASVVATTTELAYDKDAHETARRRVVEMRSREYDREYHELVGAGRGLTTVQDALEVDTRNLDVWVAEQEVEREEVATLQPQVSQLESVAEELAEKRVQERELAVRVNSLSERRGGLLDKIARCDRLQEEKGLRVAEFDAATEEKAIYEELAYAFGKKGIQAMIIDNIIPEIEDAANSLLHRMTDGRMSVQLATQRDAKSTKSVIETLEINISDEVGMRKYELYSGGEAFRVNFALRIALSKLLARRAGAQLQTLVIDEGFGSQDGQGRDKLVGAIRSIQDDFEKILVITHIEELKDEFPVRINVIKTALGSKIVMGENVA